MRLSHLHFVQSDNKRSQLIKNNILAGVAIKGISIIASFLLVPLTIGYISSEIYGIWLTLSSIIHWISFFDIGFGNGLRNKLCEALAVNDFEKGKTYTSTTYFIISIIFIPIAIISFFSAKYINWASMLNVSQDYNPILIQVAQILFVTFSFQMILKLIQSVSLAYQLNALSSLMDCLSNVLCLISVYLMSVAFMPDLKAIAWAFSLSPLIALTIFSLILYLSNFKRVAPSICNIDIKQSTEIFNLGGNFFIIQIATIILYQMINIIISRVCGPDYVTQYNIAYKYLTTAMIIITIVVAPIWSAFTDAYIKEDTVWMNRVYQKLTKMFIITCIGICFLVLISPYVYKIWIGDKVYVDFTMTVLVGIYTIIGVFGQINSSILNGIGKIRFQLIYSVAIMTIFIPLALVLGQAWGINGILTAMILVNAPGFYFGRYQVLHLINRTAKGIWNK